MQKQEPTITIEELTKILMARGTQYMNRIGELQMMIESGEFTENIKSTEDAVMNIHYANGALDAVKSLVEFCEEESSKAESDS